MASQPNIEYEAAKFLQKLIQDSKDEPDKLATKLYVILQHMRASGKENSLPYQVISRAMETVVSQHGFNMESLQQPPNPVNDEDQIAHANPHSAGGAPQDSNSSLRENELHQPLAGPSSVVPGSVPHLRAISTEHESPSSIDTKSANSTSYERRDSSTWEQQATQKDNRSSVKRKRPELPTSDAHMDNSQQQHDTHIGNADAKKGLMNRLDLPRPFPGTSSFEPSACKGGVDSDYWRQKPLKDASISSAETSLQGHLLSTNQRDMPMGGATCNPSDTSMRSGNPRDAGKSPMLTAPAYILPFKEHHLKQLRAQCLVFLAFRNGLMPKRPHLEIALGSTLSIEGSSAEGALSDPGDNKVKERHINESRSNPDIASQQGNVVTSVTERVPSASFVATTGLRTVVSGKEGENGTPSVEKSVPYADPTLNDEGKRHLQNTQRAMEIETRNHENRVPAFLPIQSNDVSSLKSSSNHDIGHLHSGAMNQESPAMGLSKQLNPETIRWAAVGVHNETSRGPFSASVAQHELLARQENSASHSQGLGEIATQGHQCVDGSLSNPWKPRQGLNNEKQKIVPTHDSTTMLLRHGSNVGANHMIGANTPFSQLEKMFVPGETDNSSGGVQPPKYTTSEKWIMIQHKRRILHEENWMQKQQKVNQRIAARFHKLKETVHSSEDISAKTRSVIELKKLQLLGLQRRLRSNIVNDFFKPITTEIDRLKAIKKHRIGRRMKHVERYEQRMKEERQKRIRERQKEFFSEVEFHRERLEDVFKFKRERLKGFNRYVKEFHKRKERVHREKIDRIQREKINLLKINDVEGYLRMVQDAKSDRVNKLLKETEKYLQKLSAKLQEAKSISKQFETDTDENQSASLESCDIVTETEDEGDQAKHYKESNEKYYLMAHSIKESIPEQPTGLRGGKLREYQMNGLRWLVSLYNNHLNGILADEMGLGKTVQVISLICYLMETKNDRGPFLVVVPSSVLPGWESELNFWAPNVNKIVYSGPPEERRRLFKERIVHQKFNVLLTTYEYLMNKHDRPKLTKVQWRYIIIDEGHRIKNASCKLNADLKLYQSSHRLLLTGTPLQNNLEELWALLNFLLPNIFNSSEDFSQWFNKPFESNGDSSPDEALLSEEENLLIINRLHQVLRPFVLRRLKHKVENELPEKIERLVRCEASAYQKLLMKRVEDNLGSLGNSKARAVHNSVMELRNICNHPYISQLHSDEVDNLIPKHFLPPIVRLCGKLEMLDRLLPKLKATNHRVLLFSTMTRLLDVMEEYLAWKKYHYLRLDGHTSGLDRGALIDQFNRPDSPYFIFLLSIRAGGVGVNLQAADTVIIFDTDWNPQVDLQAQARAHRIGQKKDVLVLRLETVNTVEEQVRASAEHKLGVANQSITAGFFDNNTSAEDRREYLEALLRESKKEEAAPVLADDALNDLLARSELEIDVFESIDQGRHEEEMATWKTLAMEQATDDSHVIPPLPSRLVTEDDLKSFLEAMKAYELSELASDGGLKRKAGSSGSFDTQYYGRGKRPREVRSYEEQWTEEEFEKMCQTESADAHKLKDELKDPLLKLEASFVATKTELAEPRSQIQQAPLNLTVESSATINSVSTPPVKRGRGRPRRIPINSTSVQNSAKPIVDLPKVSNPLPSILNSSHDTAVTEDIKSAAHQADVGVTPKSDAISSMPPNSGVQITSLGPSISAQSKAHDPKGQGSGEPVRRRGRKPKALAQPSEQSVKLLSVDGASSLTAVAASLEQRKLQSDLEGSVAEPSAVSSALPIVRGTTQDAGVDSTSLCETATAGSQSSSRAAETQNMLSEGEVTTIMELSPCISTGPSASGTSHLAVGTEVRCSPIISAALTSSSTPCTSAKLPGKRQRRKSQIGPDSPAAGSVPASEAAADEIPLSTSHESDIMPGRRQTRRSLGKGKGQSLAATPPVSSAEQPNLSESNLSSPISTPQTGISVPSLPGSGSLGVLSQATDIPVITVLPGSGYVQGSSVSQNPMASLHNLSSAPAILAAGETAQRRRGRKKGWSANPVGKGLTSGGQQRDVYEIKKTTGGEDSSVIQSPALVGHALKSNELNFAANSLDKSDLEAKKIDRGLEVNNASLSKEVGVSSSIAGVTPMSTTAVRETSSVPCQTTRYIVLALKTSVCTDKAPSMTLETVARKKEDCKTDFNVEDSKIRQPEVNFASNAGSTSNLDEDMNAPPGFDTPRAYSGDTTTVGMPLPSVDNTGKEDALAANKETFQMDNRSIADTDQNMMDPVQVLEEDSAPPGFANDDASVLETRVEGSLNCGRRDSSDVSFAQAQDSGTLPVRTQASDEIVKDSNDLDEDSVPRDLAEAHLELDGSEKVVSSEAGVVISENRAIGGLLQVQTTAEDPKNQSSNPEATEKLLFLESETSVGDGYGEKGGNESLGDSARNVQEEKGQVSQETDISDLSVHTHCEKSDPSSDTNKASTELSTEENRGKIDTMQRADHYCRIQPDAGTNINIDDDSKHVMCEQESIHRPDEGSSRDGIQTQDSGNIFIRASKEEGSDLKELHLAGEAHISHCGGAPAISDPEICEQGSNNNEKLVACVAESGQSTADTSTNRHNLVLTANADLHNGKKDEDDSLHAPNSAFHSYLASMDTDEQHEGQDDSARSLGTCASPDSESQKNKMDTHSDADFGVLDEGQDDSHRPQATCAIPDSEAQKNKVDIEVLSNVDFGVLDKGQDDSANLHAASPDTEEQKVNMDAEMSSDADCGILDKEHDDDAHPQTACASPNTVAQINKTDCGVVNKKIDFSESTELQEESIVHAVQEIEDTSSSVVTAQKSEADHESLPDDSANLQATFVLSDTEAHKNKLDSDITSDANHGVVNEGQGGSTRSQTTCAGSDTEAHKNKMDSEMPSDADCSAVNNKICFPDSTELQEESKGHTIPEIEEQDVSLSSVATQKNEADPEILQDVDLCDLENRTEIPQNTESQEETEGPTVQEIDQQGVSLTTVGNQLKAISNISDHGIQKVEADCEMLPVEEHCAPNSTDKILEESKELTVPDTEQQDVSESPVGSQLEAHCAISGSEGKKDNAGASLPSALSVSDTEGKETSNDETLLDANMQATDEQVNDCKPCGDPEMLHEQDLDVEAKMEPTDIISEIKDQEMLVGEGLQALSEVSGFQECEDQVVKETTSQVNKEAGNIDSETESKVETKSEIVAEAEAGTLNVEPELCFQPEAAVNTQAKEWQDQDAKETNSQVNKEAGCISLETEIKVGSNSELIADAEAGTLKNQPALDFQPEADINKQAEECEDQVGKETAFQVNKEFGCIISETESKVETNSEVRADAEPGTSNNELALGFQPEAAVNTQGMDDDMDDCKPSGNPDELQELDAENVINATDTNTKNEVQEILIDISIQASSEIGDFQASSEIGDFQQCEDHAGKEIISEVNKEFDCTNSETEVKIETDTGKLADGAGTLRVEPSLGVQPEAVAKAQATDAEMVDFKSCEDPDELQELDAKAKIKRSDTNSEIEEQDMLVDEHIQESHQIGAFEECIDQIGKEMVSHVDVEPGCIHSETMIETNSEISAGISAGTLKDEEIFEAQPVADSIIVSEAECGKIESADQTEIASQVNVEPICISSQAEKIETNSEISAGTLKDEEIFEAQPVADSIIVSEEECGKIESADRTEIASQVNVEPGCISSQAEKIETNSEISAGLSAGTLKDEEIFEAQPVSDSIIVSEAECGKIESADQTEIASQLNVEPGCVSSQAEKIETNSEISAAVLAVTFKDEETFEPQPEVDSIVVSEAEYRKTESVDRPEIVSEVNVEPGCINSEAKIETNSEVSADVLAGMLIEEETFEPQPEADSIVVSETEYGNIESVQVNVEPSSINSEAKLETDSDISAGVLTGTLKDGDTFFEDQPELLKNETHAEADPMVVAETGCGESESIADLPLSSLLPLTADELQKDETNAEADPIAVSETQCGKSESVAELPISTETLTDVELQKKEPDVEADPIVVAETECGKSGSLAELPMNSEPLTNVEFQKNEPNAEMLVHTCAEDSAEAGTSVLEIECQKTQVSQDKVESRENPTEAQLEVASIISETECQKNEINECDAISSASEGEPGNSEARLEVASTVSEAECQKDEINALTNEDSVTPLAETTLSEPEGEKNESKAEVVVVSDARDQEIEVSALESPKTES